MYTSKIISALCAIFMVLVFTSPAADASNCARNQYNHNGSIMDYEVCDGGRITISYARPRAGMVQQGVRSGTLLFDGFANAGGVINGTARLFSARCGVQPYAVTGRDYGNSIQLNGTAPVRGGNCQIARYRQDNLVFSLIGGGVNPGGPNVVQPSCPPGFVLSGGQCIRQNAGPVPQPAPQPAPGAGGGDWYAIAISTTSQSEAQRKANQLGGGWYVMNTAQCPNFRNGYWIATAGPTSKGSARAYANRSRGAYIKTCH